MWYRIGRPRNWTLEQYLCGERIITVSFSQGLHHRKVSCCLVLAIFYKAFLVHWYADEDFFSICNLNFEISSVRIKVIIALSDEYGHYFVS